MGKSKVTSGRGARKKGANFENEIAKLMGDWWKARFRRTPLSGGWGESLARGDLIPIESPDFPFCLECKRCESFDLYQLLTGDVCTGPISGWWSQSEEASNSHNPKLVSLLVIKVNYKPILAVVKCGVARALKIDTPTIDFSVKHGEYGRTMLTAFPIESLTSIDKENVLKRLIGS